VLHVGRNLASPAIKDSCLALDASVGFPASFRKIGLGRMLASRPARQQRGEEMLQWISNPKRKRETEDKLKAKLLDARLPSVGFRKIKSRRRKPVEIYAAGPDRLWVAFDERDDLTTPRFLNFFGIFEPNEPAQQTTVEVNISRDNGDANVHGCFVENAETGDILLMHDGTLNDEFGKNLGLAFLRWSNMEKFNVSLPGGTSRKGFLVSKVDDPSLVDNIWAYVKEVDRFKRTRPRKPM
jgi:hypothetical protein